MHSGPVGHKSGWHDLQPDLRPEPYVFAAGQQPPGSAAM